jgi:hypothetical protein
MQDLHTDFAGDAAASSSGSGNDHFIFGQYMVEEVVWWERKLGNSPFR